MIYLTSSEIDRIISEDVPLYDITTQLLNLDGCGKICFYSRNQGILCGSEEVEKIFKKLDISTSFIKPSGTSICPNDLVLEGVGLSQNLHISWKICTNILEYMSGIATLTNNFVKKARAVNSKVCIAATRKYLPFSKKLVMKAITVGGAVPHRVSLSDTVLIFKQHMEFKPYEEIVKELSRLKSIHGIKQIGIEVDTVNQAINALKNGFDFVQLDKMNTYNIVEVVEYRNKNNFPAKIAIAGGINIDNVEEFARTGADIIVTSSLYWAKPLDFKVEFIKI